MQQNNRGSKEGAIEYLKSVKLTNFLSAHNINKITFAHKKKSADYRV